MLLSGLLMFIAAGCIRYSFTGSTLPSYIKSVNIPLVENRSTEIGLEEKLRESVYSSFSSINLLQITEGTADSELRLAINSYRNVPDEYDASGNVKSYKVVLDVSVNFLDLKENDPLFEGIIQGLGVYNHLSESEETGVQTALKMINEIIINNTISGW